MSPEPLLPEENLYGYMLEFEDDEALVEAARKLREEGYERIEAFTPFEVEELEPVLPKKMLGLGWIILFSGMTGTATGFFLQWYSCVVSYPLNVGGRPLDSWPSWLAITFELTVLFASFGAMFGMFGLNKLPQLYHPVFNVPQFERASRDRFFLCLEKEDRLFDRERTFDFMRGLEPIGLYEVPA